MPGQCAFHFGRTELLYFILNCSTRVIALHLGRVTKTEGLTWRCYSANGINVDNGLSEEKYVCFFLVVYYLNNFSRKFYSPPHNKYIIKNSQCSNTLRNRVFWIFVIDISFEIVDIERRLIIFSILFALFSKESIKKSVHTEYDDTYSLKFYICARVFRVLIPFFAVVHQRHYTSYTSGTLCYHVKYYTFKLLPSFFSTWACLHLLPLHCDREKQMPKQKTICGTNVTQVNI